MPEERDDFERTEEPTPRRREEAKKRGQVARSRYLIPTATLLAATLVLYWAGPHLLLRWGRLSLACFSLAGKRQDLLWEDLWTLFFHSGLLLLPILAPLLAAVAVGGVGGGLLQTGFLWSLEPLRPDLSRLNPLGGLRRLLGLEALAEFLKALLSIGCLGALGFFFLSSQVPFLSSLPSLEVPSTLYYGAQRAVRILGGGLGILFVLSTLDYLFQRWRTETRLRMSRRELKEELREQEGDPLMKSRLKSLRQRQARQRMMQEVPRADVVITNPQELAVALCYRMEEMAAPRVVAKGAGFLAHKIRDLARKNGVPIVENRPLARLLYRTVEVGQEVPESLYRAVAEVLAYVYRLRQEVWQGQP